MRKALQGLTALLAAVVLLLNAACAAAKADAPAEGLVQLDPVEDTYVWPEGADASQAIFYYTFTLPRFELAHPSAAAVNGFYAYLAQQLKQEAAQLAVMDETGIRSATYTIMHNTSRYLSVVRTTAVFGGNGELELLAADTFALDGMYAGEELTLSQLLGLEDADGVARRLAYRLVWQIISRVSMDAQSGYLDGITEAAVQSAFEPETDFYLDEDGNVVFFIQPGILAGEVEGVLRFPFSVAELLSAVKQ